MSLLGLLLLWSRHNRDVLVVTIAATATASLAGLLVAAQLEAIAAVSGCRIGLDSAGVVDCRDVQEFEGLFRPAVLWLSFLPALPMAVGVILGAVLVAGERERGTLAFSWALAPSRAMWFAERLVPAAALVVIVGFAVSFVSYRAAAAEYPGVDLSASFRAYGSWGAIVPARGLAGLAAGALAGVALSRSIPAVLGAGLLAVALGLSFVPVQRLAPPAELWVASPTQDRVSGDDIVLTDADLVLAPNGELIPRIEAELQMPANLREAQTPAEAEEAYAWLVAHFPPARMVIPGRAMATIVARDTVLLASATVLILGVATWQVRRTRVA